MGYRKKKPRVLIRPSGCNPYLNLYLIEFEIIFSIFHMKNKSNTKVGEKKDTTYISIYFNKKDNINNGKHTY